MEDWKKRLEELSFTKGYYFKLGDNGLVEKKDDQLIFNREVLEAFVKQELSKAREEGYQNCMDDIWEEARGLRSWTEHDGSISSADIEAGLQEAYLSIEDKLKNNK